MASDSASTNTQPLARLLWVVGWLAMHTASRPVTRLLVIKVHWVPWKRSKRSLLGNGRWLRPSVVSGDRMRPASPVVIRTSRGCIGGLRFVGAKHSLFIKEVAFVFTTSFRISMSSLTT
jgi:hypothetical protein